MAEASCAWPKGGPCRRDPGDGGGIGKGRRRLKAGESHDGEHHHEPLHEDGCSSLLYAITGRRPRSRVTSRAISGAMATDLPRPPRKIEGVRAAFPRAGPERRASPTPAPAINFPTVEGGARRIRFVEAAAELTRPHLATYCAAPSSCVPERSASSLSWRRTSPESATAGGQSSSIRRVASLLEDRGTGAQ
jgi:hypothetical protein